MVLPAAFDNVSCVENESESLRVTFEQGNPEDKQHVKKLDWVSVESRVSERAGN